MSTRQTRWILTGSLLMALAACDVDVIDCDEEPEAKICQDDEEDLDAGDEPTDEEDADVDASKTLDAGSDASTDGGTGNDASVDGATGSDSSVAISVDDFCVAQLATAVAWRDELEELCGPTDEAAAREKFLLEVLAYPAEDAEGKCISARNAPITAGNTTFDGTKAMACASAFTANFAAPPDPFPSAGIDLVMHESKIAHGAPVLIQIPACRAAFKGKLARDKACSDNFECVDGLRCMDAPGGTKTCQPALVGGTCTQTSICADNYTCVGSTSGGGKTCVKSDELPLSGGNCRFSLECAVDYVCNASGKCVPPSAQVICKP